MVFTLDVLAALPQFWTDLDTGARSVQVCATSVAVWVSVSCPGTLELMGNRSTY